MSIISCGNFSKTLLHYSESQHHHTYFNRKLYISSSGELKNAPECTESFGNIQDINSHEELKQIVPAGKSLAALALKWILDFDAVSTVIPGASKPEQVTRNLEALNEQSLSAEQMQRVQAVYEKYIKASVHHLW